MRPCEQYLAPQQQRPGGDFTLIIPNLVNAQFMFKESVLLLEINMHFLAYLRGRLFMIATVKLVHMLVGAFARPSPDNDYVFLINAQKSS